ncbi:PucR family transcriptional regulator [Arthrobacter roseus]|uniref:PucR family transcriptional regulator n=1 Tax=Arthrobacter roseus TaxID=136274 RepID=UPI001962F233|nr:PucR family transcriptional regulator [Arthrobacter roseus]MBM7849424.1 purine catabolism regulator [Arthrobacter roseus]
MAITLRTLLASRSLNLNPAGPALAVENMPIAWVAMTELEDPRPFLTGGEVVLTTGIRLKTTTTQRAFARHVHAAGSLALGFGVGLGHRKAPAAVLEEAAELGLPVFEVPYETPFMAIGKLVADAQSAEHYQYLENLLTQHQVLAASLLGGKGLPALLRELASMLRTDVALWQYGTELLSTGPSGQDHQWHRVPIATGLKDRCTLAMAEPYSRNPIVDYAQSLISLELSNQATLRSRSRAANGQLLSDVVSGFLSGPDAELRLAAAGIDVGAKWSVLLVEAASGQRRALRTLPLPSIFDQSATALVDERLVIMTTATPSQVDGLAEYLYSAGLTARIGMGGTYSKASGLRWSYFEARESLTRGRSVNLPDKLSLTSLLLASTDVPLGDLAAESLNPVTAFDKKHDADLLRTLESYLELDGSVAAVADSMELHRNTVRYRLQQVAKLSGHDPTTTAGRVHLYLAVHWMRLG